ncbi:ABC transporter ATP-binding protein [Syntrophus buswellii]|uniref:ABC transporter ATP-binding protein n=1 Tax=Syntrophus buswellii TaxID=43774 RepID=UPI0038D431E6
MLEVLNIHTYYGLSHILFSESLHLERGEIVGLFGRNGAGKSTTMRSIMGLTPPREGRIIYNGEDITGQKPYRLFRKGIGYVPDDRRVFADLTVDENLDIVYNRRGDWSRKRVYDVFPALSEIKSRRAGFLSGGEQQMLTIARALMGSPELILLDEPIEGLAPLVVRSLEELILLLRDSGISILLSEQNIRSAVKLVNRVYVIDNGFIRFEGTAAEFEADDEVKKKYLMV